MDHHGRTWTALARTGNAVSGATRIEGSNPSRSAKSLVQQHIAAVVRGALGAIEQIVSLKFDPHHDATPDPDEFGWTLRDGCRISPQNAVSRPTASWVDVTDPSGTRTRRRRWTEPAVGVLETGRLAQQNPDSLSVGGSAVAGDRPPR
jgi:hypothetical protein